MEHQLRSKCLYGIKKNGHCKKKPGPKKGGPRRRKSKKLSHRRYPRKTSRRRYRRDCGDTDPLKRPVRDPDGTMRYCKKSRRRSRRRRSKRDCGSAGSLRRPVKEADGSIRYCKRSRKKRVSKKRSRKKNSYKGLTIVSNDASGDCLFESLSLGLAYLYPPGPKHQTPSKLRKKIVSKITMKWYQKATNGMQDTYAFDYQFVTSRDDDEEIREEASAPNNPLYIREGGVGSKYLAHYRRFMRVDGTYGTAIELMAFTEAYKTVQVIVHQRDRSRPLIYFYRGREYHRKQKSPKEINILWTGGEHYEFLRPTAGWGFFSHSGRVVRYTSPKGGSSIMRVYTKRQWRRKNRPKYRPHTASEAEIERRDIDILSSGRGYDGPF